MGFEVSNTDYSGYGETAGDIFRRIREKKNLALRNEILKKFEVNSWEELKKKIRRRKKFH